MDGFFPDSPSITQGTNFLEANKSIEDFSM